MRGITNLGSYIEAARASGDLCEIERPADPFLEVAAVARATDGGPVVLFKNVKGHPGRSIVSNVFGSRERIATPNRNGTTETSRGLRSSSGTVRLHPRGGPPVDRGRFSSRPDTTTHSRPGTTKGSFVAPFGHEEPLVVRTYRA